MLPPLLLVALRNVARNRRRSRITFLAVFLSVGVMISVKGFFTGMQASIRESTVLGQTGSLQVHRKGFGKSASAVPLQLDVPSDGALLSKILALPGVKAATARIVFSGMANANDVSGPALFAAIDPQRELAVCPQRMEMVSIGQPLVAAGPSAGILTPELAKSLTLKLGQRAALLSYDRDGVMSALEFDFVGLYGQPGFPLRDKKFGFVPLALAQTLLRMEGRATEIAVAIENLDEAERFRPLLQAAVGAEYEVATWHDVAPFLDDMVAGQNFVLGMLSAIFMFVALLGIVNTMLMSVQERTREIGTMMALGVSRHQILSLFVLEATLLGLSGGLLGAAVGKSLVSYFGHAGIVLKIPGMLAPLHIYPRVQLGYVLSYLLLSAGGAAAAALWPAIRASRMRPVQALAAV
jgi:putative ABC transport system permease protein